MGGRVNSCVSSPYNCLKCFGDIGFGDGRNCVIRDVMQEDTVGGTYSTYREMRNINNISGRETRRQEITWKSYA
jgi:hypothetical protein